MRLPSFRNTKLKRTKRGNFVRNLGGVKIDLGTDELQAGLRRDFVNKIYIENVRMAGGLPPDGSTSNVPWGDSYLEIARQIGRHGTAVVKTVSPDEWYSSDNPLSSFSPPDYSYIDRLRSQGVPIDVVGGGQFAGRLPEATISGSNSPATTKAQAAFAAFKATRLAEFSGTYQTKMQLERVIDSIIEWFDETLWLCQLDQHKCNLFVKHFRDRPVTKHGKPASKSWCKEVLSEFKSGCKMIAKKFPDEFELPEFPNKIRIERLPSDAKGNSIQDKALLRGEAKLAFRNANQPMTKLMLALGVNTCSAASELGRMTVQDFKFDSVHPFSEVIEFTGEHSFMITTRRKKFTHHEALLWPWVAEMVKQQIRVCNANGWKYLFTDESGPLYKCNEVYDDVGLPAPNSKKPESKFNTRWRSTKCKKSFSKVRKSFSNFLVLKKRDDLGTLALAHQTDEDNLLKHYANKPFARLFEATLEFESEWDLR